MPEILKSNSIGVTAQDKNGATLKLDFSAFQGVIDANPGIEIHQDAKNVISFKGTKLLTFAFKAIAAWIEIGGAARFRLAKPTGPIGPLRAVPSDLRNPRAPITVLLGEGALLRIGSRQFQK
ncbi:MAG: hypothetical protein V3U53_07730 [bacterium]